MNRVKTAMIGVLIGVVFCCTMNIMSPYGFVHVLSDSMEPELYSGDILIYDKTRLPEKGDIILFYKESDGGVDRLVKRVTNVSGELVETENGTIDTCVVPPDCYFVLGDNSNVSVDSRTWTDPFVKAEDVIGVVIWHS